MIARSFWLMFNIISFWFLLLGLAMASAPALSRRDVLVNHFPNHYISYSVLPHDSLSTIAKKYDTTVEFIKIKNNLTQDKIVPGEHLLIWDKNFPFRIVVKTNQHRLLFYLDQTLLKIYPVSTGQKETATPLGVFKISSRYKDPAWFHKGHVIPAGNPEDALGSRWLGLSRTAYGIHGTIHPYLIGRSVSHGCVRMKNQDIQELYNYIPLGTVVVIQ